MVSSPDINQNILGLTLCQVLRDFKAPEGMGAQDMDAAGDGELLVVLDLRAEVHFLFLHRALRRLNIVKSQPNQARVK